MNENTIKDKIKALDTENKINISSYTYNNGTVIKINYVVIKITNNKIAIYPQMNKLFFRSKLYNDIEEVNNIKIMKDTLCFLDNNLDKIKTIIKEEVAEKSKRNEQIKVITNKGYSINIRHDDETKCGLDCKYSYYNPMFGNVCGLEFYTTDSGKISSIKQGNRTDYCIKFFKNLID